MFHLTSIIVAIAIIIPAMSTPVLSSGSSMSKRRINWKEDMEFAEKALGATERVFNLGSAAGNIIAPIIEKFTNKPKNNTQERRSVENLGARGQETRAIYEVRESQDIEFVEARSGNFSLKNILQHAGHTLKNAVTSGHLLKDAAAVGGIVEDVGEAAAVFLREYETDIDELD